MIEMDRFVHVMNGNETEKIVRHSESSAATMKEQGTTLLEYTFNILNFIILMILSRIMNDIKERRNPKTWCGFPHNLLLPRSREISLGRYLEDAQEFVLMAFVNDVDQDVFEGSDGIEHM